MVDYAQPGLIIPGGAGSGDSGSTVSNIPPYEEPDLSEKSLRHYMETRVWSHFKAALSDDEVSDAAADVWLQIERVFPTYEDDPVLSERVDRIIEAYYDRAVTYINTGQDPWAHEVTGEGMTFKQAAVGAAFVGAGLVALHRLFTGEWLWETL